MELCLGILIYWLFSPKQNKDDYSQDFDMQSSCLWMIVGSVTAPGGVNANPLKA